MKSICNVVVFAILCLAVPFAVESQQPEGKSPIIDAAVRGDVDAVRRMLSSGANPNQKNSLGQTPLLYASYFGHAEVVKLLLEAGAAVNARVGNGPNPLILSSNKGHLEVVKLLIFAGANVEVVQEDGGTALIEATQKPGNIEIVKLLVQKGANVNAIKKDGATPLVLAATTGDTAVMKVLLDHGAQPNVRFMGLTPLYFAVHEDHVEAAQLLLNHGADADATSPDGKSVREFAEELGNYAMQRIFGVQKEVSKADAGAVTIQLLATEYDALFSCEGVTLRSDEFVLYTSTSRPLKSLDQLSGHGDIGFSPDIREEREALTFVRCLLQFMEARGKDKESFMHMIVAGGAWKSLFTDHPTLRLFVVPKKHFSYANTISATGGGSRLMLERREE